MKKSLIAWVLIGASVYLYENRWLDRTEIKDTATGQTKAYLYPNRWTGNTDIKRIDDHKKIGEIRYNRWLDRYELRTE